MLLSRRSKAIGGDSGTYGGILRLQERGRALNSRPSDSRPPSQRRKPRGGFARKRELLLKGGDTRTRVFQFAGGPDREPEAVAKRRRRRPIRHAIIATSRPGRSLYSKAVDRRDGR